MEVLEITPGWVVELPLPECELRLDGCTGDAAQGVRVHGCAFHYSCNSCVHTFLRRVSKGYRLYRNMRCSSCKEKFTKSDKYFTVVEL